MSPARWRPDEFDAHPRLCRRLADPRFLTPAAARSRAGLVQPRLLYPAAAGDAVAALVRGVPVGPGMDLLSDHELQGRAPHHRPVRRDRHGRGARPGPVLATRPLALYG